MKRLVLLPIFLILIFSGCSLTTKKAPETYSSITIKQENLIKQGKLEEALAFSDRRMILAKKDPLAGDSAWNDSLLKKIELLRKLKRYDELEKSLTRLLEYRRENFPPGDPDLAVVYHDLADLLRSGKKELARAREYYKKALEIRRMHKDRAEEAKILIGLAEVLKMEDQLDEALRSAGESLEILDRMESPPGTDMVAVLRLLASLEADRGNQEIALKYLHRASSLPGLDEGLKKEIAVLYKEIGREDSAIKLLEEEIAEKEGKLGKNSPELIPLLMELADAYKKQGDVIKSKKNLLRILDFRKFTGSEKKPVIISAMMKLAEIFGDEGNTEAADEYIQLALETGKSFYKNPGTELSSLFKNAAGLVSGWENSRYKIDDLLKESLSFLPDKEPYSNKIRANIYVLLADHYLGEKQFVQSRESLEKAFQELKKIDDFESLEIEYRALVKSKELYFAMGDPAKTGKIQEKKIIPLLKRMLTLYDRNGRKKRSNLANIYERLGYAYQQVEGKLALAEDSYKKALDLREKDGSIGDSSVLYNLGEVLFLEGKLDEAESCLKKSEEVFKDKQSPGSGDLAITYNLLGRLYIKKQELATAEHYINKALGLPNLEDENFFEIQKTRNQLYNELGKGDQAIKRLERELRRKEEALGKDSPELIPVISALAEQYRVNYRLPEAEANFKRAISLQEKKEGSRHPDLIPLYLQLGIVCRELRQDQESVDAFDRALVITRRAYGLESKKTATVLNQMMEFYRQIPRNYKRAEELGRAALTIDESRLPEGKLAVCRDLNDLGKLYIYMKRWKDARASCERSVKLLNKIPKRERGQDWLLYYFEARLYLFEYFHTMKQYRTAYNNINEVSRALSSKLDLPGREKYTEAVVFGMALEALKPLPEKEEIPVEDEKKEFRNLLNLLQEDIVKSRHEQAAVHLSRLVELYKNLYLR
ncbi:MAG: tetratricopeptide repeat protein [Candidatus Eremiobacteraeota bacterium]|nr:tetratricopeptide repeat protein [Candidatus Eremiobacteraeota bacterium]